MSLQDTEYENSAKVAVIKASSIVYSIGSGEMLVGVTIPLAGVLKNSVGRDYKLVIEVVISLVKVLN
jgi:hypothetical protein